MEDQEKPVEPLLLVVAFLPDEFLGEIVPQKPATGGERERELLRAPDAFRGRRKESLQQLAHGRGAIFAETESRIF